MTDQTQTPADQAASGENRRPAIQLRRWLLMGYGVLMALLVGSFISALLGLLWPLLFNSAPDILAFFIVLPLWLRVLLCLACL